MKKLIAAALVGTMVLTMAGCGSKTSETTGSEASSDAAGGTLVMATNAEFPPYEYYEGENVVGIDADIAAAVADKLGMELKIGKIWPILILFIPGLITSVRQILDWPV